MENDVIELLDILYGMVNEAWSVPLGNDKCIIEREKAIEIINDIKSNLPGELAEAKRLVAARDEFIGAAKRDAEALRKSAEDKARSLVDNQEIVRAAKQRSAELLQDSEVKAEKLKEAAGQYVAGIIKQAEDNLGAALDTVRRTGAAFSGAVAAVEKKPEPAKSPEQPAPSDELNDDDFAPVTSSASIIQQFSFDEGDDF